VKPPRSKVTPHVFQPDPDVPPDPLSRNAREVCRTCHLLGQPGDAHHTMPEPVEDAQSRAAGERSGGDR
jgi:hypothetical protein